MTENILKVGYQLGRKGENIIYYLLKSKFPKNNIKKTDRYCFYDFEIEGKNILIEVKNRNISKDKYKTTIFGYDKLIKFNDFNKTKGNKYIFIIIFIYKDGIYFHKYNKKYNYEIKPYHRNSIYNHTFSHKPHIFFPINKLLEINSILV